MIVSYIYLLRISTALHFAAEHGQHRAAGIPIAVIDLFMKYYIRYIIFIGVQGHGQHQSIKIWKHQKRRFSKRTMSKAHEEGRGTHMKRCIERYGAYMQERSKGTPEIPKLDPHHVPKAGAVPISSRQRPRRPPQRHQTPSNRSA